MSTKKPDDWMETAERVGDQVAKGLEAFGDRVQKALESFDEVGRSRSGGVTIDDQRDVDDGVAVETLLRGDVYEHQDELYMRLGTIPNARRRGDEIDGVNLRNGDVQGFQRGLRVRQVDARVVVRAKE
jgi:hypothetical protein